MPKLSCNGFSMFATHVRPTIEAERGERFACAGGGLSPALIEAVTPLWNKLDHEQKRAWKERAKNYKHTDEFVERKRQARAHRSPAPPPRERRASPSAFEPTADDFGADEDGRELDLGVPHGPAQHHEPPRYDAAAPAADFNSSDDEADCAAGPSRKTVA